MHFLQGLGWPMMVNFTLSLLGTNRDALLPWEFVPEVVAYRLLELYELFALTRTILYNTEYRRQEMLSLV